MKKFLVRILFRLLDPVPESDIDEEKIQKWLAESWQHPGFQEYIRLRGKKFQRELTTMLILDAGKYDKVNGQRFENLNLARLARNAFDNRKK